ncbi:hypothetical protein QNH39_18530 [Neobacillus novalis]|uniref:Uncharacterized protein n=2 Tax=Neobacillus novalis TaxID=220687 RepID=A0AA95MJB1_9BACI|nr:hypothetical protein [Neobacillus novalis]WHY84635.1 hypothetical protein QNH39_18530 [Neobacillus novalis]
MEVETVAMFDDLMLKIGKNEANKKINDLLKNTKIDDNHNKNNPNRFLLKRMEIKVRQLPKLR